MIRKTRLTALLTTAAAAFTLGAFDAAPLRAQEANWPGKPIRLVVPFAPAGTSDILARVVGQKISESLGQPVVIDNVPGAGGSVGAERVARAMPDGYTILMGHIGTHAVNPLVNSNVGYDPVKDFAPVAWVAKVPNVLVVHPSVPARNLKELVAYARSRPGELNYGTGGNGSAAHLAMEYLKMQANMSMVHVPYRGAAPAMTALVAGQTHLGFPGVPAASAFLRSGRLRPIAVSSTKRLDLLPDVRTVAESGYPHYEADQWYGVMAPAGTPAAIVRKMNQHINQALGAADLRQRLQGEGAVPAPTTPEAFGKHIAQEIARWRPVIQAAGISAN